MLRFLTAGESHGPALTAIVEGMPAGVPVTEEAINRQLARRQVGFGRGGRMQIERDTRARPLRGAFRQNARFAHRAAHREPRLGELDGAHARSSSPPEAGTAHHHAASRPRRPAGHDEI